MLHEEEGIMQALVILATWMRVSRDLYGPEPDGQVLGQDTDLSARGKNFAPPACYDFGLVSAALAFSGAVVALIKPFRKVLLPKSPPDYLLSCTITPLIGTGVLGGLRRLE
ncbi:MAG: hypothetical protein Q9224_000434 [Gallowayella concinna]